jgi:hypothetical protein
MKKHFVIKIYNPYQTILLGIAAIDAGSVLSWDSDS